MSYLSDYLEYSTGNEAPDLFHLWAGYVTISTAVSRKVWLPFEDTAMFPNIYVMLVGDAGNGKSWSMSKAKRVMAEAGITHISGSLETPPGMWRYMAGNPATDPPTPSPVKFVAKWPDGVLRDCHPMTIIANEFVNFISLDERGWINGLNDIYDEDVYKYRTKNMGEDILVGPYIVLLGALTTEVSSDLQKARIISTGLARRTIFQYGERQWDNPHPKPEFNERQRAARVRCVEYLRKLNDPSCNGPFDWAPDVDEWWTSWYVPHLASVPTRNPNVKSWYASKSSQLLKLAMLTSLSESLDLKLQVKHFETSLRYLEVLEEDLPKIFGGVGRNELAGVAMKMLEFVQNLPDPTTIGKMRGQFFNSCRPPHDFDECINYLTETKQLVRKTFMLNKILLDLLATEETMSAFVARHSLPQNEAPSESRPASSPEARP